MGQTPAIQELPGTTIPSHYTWAFPGSPVRVRLALSVVQRLEQTLDAGSPKEGVLLGRVSAQITEIIDFAATSGDGPDTITEIVESTPRSGPLQPVGYYRIHHDPVLRLNSDDIALAESTFPNPNQVILLVQPGDFPPATASFFFWDNGQMCDFPFLEFPFDSSSLADVERQKTQAALTRSLEKPPQVEPESSDPLSANRQTSSSPRIRYRAAILALPVTALIGLALVPRLSRRLWPPPAVPAPAQRESFKRISLGLQAQRQNGDLKVTWNGDSPLLATAASGTLSIEEGGKTRTIQLDPAQIRTGSILYAPNSDQVQIQMTISGPQTTSESVIVILPKTGKAEVQVLAPREAQGARLTGEKAASAPVPPPRPTKPFTSPVAQAANKASEAPLTVSEPPDLGLKAVRAIGIPSQLGQTAAPPAPESTTSRAPSSALPSPAVTLPAVTPPAATPPAPQPANSGSGSESKTASAPSGYEPPVVVNSVTPLYPATLKGMGLAAKTIEVKVFLDETGKVIKAEPVLSKVWVPESMIQSSLTAARLWKFKPARKGTRPIPSEMMLRFEFVRPQ